MGSGLYGRITLKRHENDLISDMLDIEWSLKAPPQSRHHHRIKADVFTEACLETYGSLVLTARVSFPLLTFVAVVNLDKSRSIHKELGDQCTAVAA